MKSIKTLKSFYTMRIVALALFICFFSSCSEEVKETLQEEAIVAGMPELLFSKSISLEDEYGNTVSFDVSSNVQAELDDYSAESFEFKAMTQEDLLVQEEEVEEVLDEDQIEDEATELSTGDPIVFKETNVELNTNDGFVSYRLTMKPKVGDDLEDRRDRRPYYFETTASSAMVNSRKTQWSKRVYATWSAMYNGKEVFINYQRIWGLSFDTNGKPDPNVGDNLLIEVSAQYRDHFGVSFLYWLD